MKALAAFMVISAITTSLQAQADLEVSAGLSMLVYQSVYSFEQSTAIETAVRGHALKTLDWQVGTRLGMDRMLPDIFARLLVAPRMDIRLWYWPI
jgi:hypothetical protein